MSIKETKEKIEKAVAMSIEEFLQKGNGCGVFDLQRLARSHDRLLEAAKGMLNIGNTPSEEAAWKALEQAVSAAEGE